MLYDALVAESRRDDSFDDVRTAALARARELVALLERQRAEHAGGAGPDEQDRYRARCAAIQAEIDTWLAHRSDEDGRAATLTLLLAACFDSWGFWQYEAEIGTLIDRVRGWTPDEVAVMLLRVAEYDMGFWYFDSLAKVLTAAEQLDADGRRALAPWLRRAHAELMDTDGDAHRRPSLAGRLRTLLASVDEAHIPDGLIPADAPWAAPLRDAVDIAATPELAGFVRHLASLGSPRPTQRWRRTCVDLADRAAVRETVTGTLRELAEGDPVCRRKEGRYHYHYLVHQNDGDLARGAVWAAALTGGAETVAHLGALARRAAGRGTGVTPDHKLAGAALNALAAIGDPAALDALWGLRSRIRHRALGKQLDTALVTAAARQGITAGQLVERGVPRHGLADDGSLERTLGEFRVRLSIEDGTTVRLTFTGPDGRTTRTAPAAVKDGFPDELAELKALAKEVRGTLSGERVRVEALLSAAREWPYDEWRRHYHDHPVTGALTRALIWEFQDTDGVWHTALPATHDPDSVRVRLWHPIGASADYIRTWRTRIVTERLRQPFKQAFREIYLLTPAEEETGVYSNRFAAHIVRYRQLYALFKERGWQANFLGRHDGGYDGKARAEFGDGAWRACFHHEPAEDDGRDYAPQYAATDQVRFERRDGSRWREAPLSEVPPPVFSEAMRDVDLFVAVTSIAADAEWTDRGEARHTAYWRTATFGELTPSAEIRRDVLARILPRLKIADRCSLEGRYLSVRGDVTTYRIHLGSANILMAPDDAYLCIVPARRKSDGKVFLPFEDERLALILSKAFLLAADSKITDATILRQINRGA
ncbi:DUF4132 domain-containing protein [Streptomyces sp. NPDC002758]